MYKVIIADDEKLIRNGLKNILDWETLGFEVDGVFSDGEEVLDYLDYSVPDAILTDVKMANVSGLEVARYVMEHQLQCKVVIVSGFHEFDLALKALKYGADEYLLKPVDPEELERVFRKISAELDRQRAREAKNIREQHLMRELQGILESQFLEEIVLGAAKGPDYLRSRFKMIYPELNMDTARCFLVDMSIHEFDWFIEKVWGSGRDNFEESLDSYLRSFEGGYLYRIVYKNANVVRLLAIRRRETALQPPEAAMKLLQLLQEEFEFDAEYHLQGVYPNLQALALRSARKEPKQPELFQQTQFNEQILLMLSNTVTGNHIRAQDIFHGILDAMSDMSQQQRCQSVWQILQNLCTALVEANPQMQQSIEAYIRQEDVLGLRGEAELREYCDRVFDFIRMAQSGDIGNVNELVMKAKQYIGENICRDVSREEVAAKLFICPSYLSKLFVKETGETYLAFVNTMKIDRAKELLKDPENRSYQIGEMLGYSTPKYFARLFKAQTGMTPSEYRRKVLRTEGDENEEI